MVRLARIVVAMPGRQFELQAILKEAAAIIKKVAGVEVLTFAGLGSQVGQMVSVSNYDSLADFEQKALKILASAECQAVVRKLEGLVVPGTSRDHFLRQI